MTRLQGRILALISIPFFLFSVRTAKAVSITALAGVGQSSANVNPTTGFTTGPHAMTYGWGGLVEFKMFPKVYMELGGIYIPRGYQEKAVGISPVEYTMNTLQIPLVLRVYLLPSISVGMGAYYSHAFGSLHSYSVALPAAVTDSAYGPGAYSADDYGAVGSVGLKIGFSKIPFALIVQGRYLYSLNNISNFGNTITMSEMQAFGGIRFGN